MLQSESADEDLEHFEDITEEEENQPSPPNRTDNTGEVAHNENGLENDDHFSKEEGSSTSSESEAGAFEANESSVRDRLDEPKNSISMPGSNELLPEGSNEKLSLPGGYDPRHREPSFWYCYYQVNIVHKNLSSLSCYRKH